MAIEITDFTAKIRTITGFTARVKRGAYGFKRQVAAGTITSALTAVGHALSVDDRGNLHKALGSKDCHHPIKVMLNR